MVKLYYFTSDELFVCTLRDGLTEEYRSWQYDIILIYGGLLINPNREDFDYATIDRDKYSCPDRIGYDREDGTELLVSGGDLPYFKA